MKKYDPTWEVDEKGYIKFVPKPDGVGVLVHQMKDNFTVHTSWGVLQGKHLDYVVKNHSDKDVKFPEDIWIVDKSLFENTYVLEAMTDFERLRLSAKLLDDYRKAAVRRDRTFAELAPYASTDTAVTRAVLDDWYEAIATARQTAEQYSSHRWLGDWVDTDWNISLMREINGDLSKRESRRGLFS